MSFDLYFLRPESERPVPLPTLVDFFQLRQHYTVSDTEATYSNPDTGVYFAFALGGAAGQPDPPTTSLPTPKTTDDASCGAPTSTVTPSSPTRPLPSLWQRFASLLGGASSAPAVHYPDGLAPLPLSFNMNFFRPHTFALEADRELSALTSRFDLLVDDPQVNGMGRGPYSTEAFLRSWNAGNLLGHKGFLTSLANGEVPLSNDGTDALPAATLDRLWFWNYNRADLQLSLRNEVFVPPIHLVRHNAKLITLVSWTDAVSTALPKVDAVMLIRQMTARRLPRGETSDMCLVPADSLAPLLSLAKQVDATVPYALFLHDPPPKPLTNFFRSAKPSSTVLEGVTYDRVLTQETVDAARADIHKQKNA